jgi:hypothetical protein
MKLVTEPDAFEEFHLPLSVLTSASHPKRRCMHSSENVKPLQIRLLLRILSLHLIHEVEVGLIELMHTNVAVLSTTAIASSLWVYSNVIQRAEMSPNTTDLFLEYLQKKEQSASVHDIPVKVGLPCDRTLPRIFLAARL